MWARNSSNYVKTHGLRLGSIHTCARTESLGKHVQRKLAEAEPPKCLPDPCLRSNKFYITPRVPSFSSLGNRHLSSQAGEKSGGEEDDELDEGFSELEVTKESGEHSSSESDNENELVSELDEDDAVQSPESELKVDTEHKKSGLTDLARLIMSEPKSINTLLDNYISEGKTLDNSAISHAMLVLRRRKYFWKALQFSEWLEAKKLLEFDESYYATRVDLISKVHGFQKAERYIAKIPESLRGALVYKSLISNCVTANNQKKSEEIFNKMKQLNIAASASVCNQMIIIYKKTDKKKIADILLYMEKENIKPTQVTYRLLIDTKGMANDIAGVDEIIETMKADGIEPDVSTKSVIAKHYVASGLKEKAMSILKEMEGSVSEIHSISSPLIQLYASLGKEDEVERIWKISEPNAQFYDFLAVIDAWGKLKQVEKAEAVFEKLAKEKKISSRHYSTMIRVYANNKMLNKGKDLMKRMGESGCRIGPLTWDALVRLYVEAGEVEKADSMLLKASQQTNKVKPLFSSFMTIMEHYSRRGDVHNTEKMFHRLKQAGYTSRLRAFQVLIQAYIKSKTPAYGFRERMMADNIFPNKSVNYQLIQSDPFKKTAVSDLLD